MLRTFFILVINLFLVVAVAVVNPVLATTAKVGMHVLHPSDVREAVALLDAQNGDDSDPWYYITLPFSLKDAQNISQWQSFFDEAKDLRVIPIIRLVTEPKGDVWKIPTRADIVTELNALQSLQWPTSKKRIIIFNEVNHAKEWGGQIDPAAYARTLRFASQWAQSLDENFVVLPAAMDLAATGGNGTTDAFVYWNGVFAEDPEIMQYVDAWNSHSYPNPAFSAPPTARGKNSLRGYEYELAYLAEKGVEDLPVYITETGWEENWLTSRRLSQWYRQAVEDIWLPDARVVAVTPFVFRGAPGPFDKFSFIDADGKPTVQHEALEKVLGAATIGAKSE